MNISNISPIAIFVYNRIEHLKLTIESLQKNKLSFDSKLYIFSDGAKSENDKEKISEIRNYIADIKGFKKIEIIERNENFGLAKNIISGVSEIIEKFGKIIVLEDDLVVSHDFLEYMNRALEFYENNENIFSISAYSGAIKIPENYKNDVFLLKRINSWGWASWKNRWQTIDWQMSDFEDFIKDKHQRNQLNKSGLDLSIMLLKQYQKKINSWAIRFNYACYKQNKLNVYPIGTKVINKGADGSGSNLKKTSKFKTELNTKKTIFPLHLTENKQIAENYSNFLKPSIFRQIINFFKIRLFLFNLKIFNCKKKL
ncbi:MAG: glycosyltransferase [Bacteroidales bacterium]|nr:glycosyltransferase [Bacteroidales bacterium]MBN2756790.1 glycosyltransferase [Bacteroidales bacterium]